MLLINRPIDKTARFSRCGLQQMWIEPFSITLDVSQREHTMRYFVRRIKKAVGIVERLKVGTRKDAGGKYILVRAHFKDKI